MAAIVVKSSAARSADSDQSQVHAVRSEKRELVIDSYYGLCIALACGLGYQPAVLAVVLLSFGLLFLALFCTRKLRIWRHMRGLALLTLPLVALVPFPVDQELPQYLLFYRVMCLLAFVAGVLFYSSDEKNRRKIVYGIGAGKLLLILLGVFLVRRPLIDVWQLQQLAVDFLLQGKNPYTTPVPDIYRGGYSFGHQVYYSYAPLNLLLSIPAKALLGDYRYGLVASLLAALLLFRKTGRLLGVSSYQIDFLTLLAILHPRLERMVIYGWLEPYMILLLAVCFYLWASGRGGLFATALVLCLPLLKQYVAAPLLLYVLIMRPRLAVLFGAGALAILAVTPLLMWNFDATIRNGLLFFVRSIGFRMDSLSLAVPWFLLSGYQLGVKTSLFVQLAMGLCSLWLMPRDLPALARFVMASAASLFASFLFAPQAFLNYYYFVSVLLLWAALLLSPSEAEQPEPAPQSLRTTLGHALLVVSATAAIALFASVLYYHTLCPNRASAGQAKLQKGMPILDEGALLARSTEQLFVCQSEHCFGPLCHQDLRCVCAEKESFQTPHILETELGRIGQKDAQCVMDHAQPAPTDRDGKCQRARCHERIGAAQ
ncbi:MAG TPA: hypothetical protein PKO07_18175 [Pseudomonadota bacterium]|nr:hypothetical protein [Pseudomonadota bacterium]